MTNITSKYIRLREEMARVIEKYYYVVDEIFRLMWE